jgi:hypothetical protein
MVEIFQFTESKLGKPWSIQLVIGSKRKINEMVKAYKMDMNGLSTKSYLNIIPLGSYDSLIGMDWLNMHHVFLDYYNKAFTCLDEKGNLSRVQGIPKKITIREVSTMQLKKIFKKGFQVFAVHMEEAPKDKVSNIENYAVLKDFEDVFR